MTLPRFGDRPDQQPRREVAPLPPVADFIAEVGDHQTVQFTSLSFDPDGQIVEYRWQFGEVGPGPVAPVAKFSAEALSGRRVQFTDESTDAGGLPIVGWLWEFGDGSTGSTQHPLKTYATTGDYNVRLTVTNSVGLKSTPVQQTIFVGDLRGITAMYNIFTSNTTWAANTQNIDGAVGAAGAVVSRLNWLKAERLAGRRKFWFPNFAGGADEKYADANGNFVLQKWKDEFDANTGWTPGGQGTTEVAIKNAIRDGDIAGVILIDEPHNPRWGNTFDNYKPHPRALVDAMAAHAHSRFPTMPCGPTSHYDKWDEILVNGQPYYYKECDFNYHQYTIRRGSATADRDKAEAWAQAAGMKVIFGMNVINGGTEWPKDEPPLCPTTPLDPWNSPTGGLGSRENATRQLCQAAPQQLLSVGRIMGVNSKTKIFLMWEWKSQFMTPADDPIVAACLSAIATIQTEIRQQVRINLKSTPRS